MLQCAVVADLIYAYYQCCSVHEGGWGGYRAKGYGEGTGFIHATLWHRGPVDAAHLRNERAAAQRKALQCPGCLPVVGVSSLDLMCFGGGGEESSLPLCVCIQDCMSSRTRNGPLKKEAYDGTHSRPG